MFNKILVPIDVDYPKTAAAVFKNAAAIAKLSNAEIRLVSVMPGFGMPIVASYISDEVKIKRKPDLKKPWNPLLRKIVTNPYHTG